VLNVSGAPPWVNDVVLLSYTGTLIGTPNLAGVIINTPTGLFSYSGMSVGNGQIVLLDVEMPEPGSMGLLAMLTGVAILRRRRRR
jgi:hypothetical protein